MTIPSHSLILSHSLFNNKDDEAAGFVTGKVLWNPRSIPIRTGRIACRSGRGLTTGMPSCVREYTEAQRISTFYPRRSCATREWR
jgi:hypothetical protein